MELLKVERQIVLGKQALPVSYLRQASMQERARVLLRLFFPLSLRYHGSLQPNPSFHLSTLGAQL